MTEHNMDSIADILVEAKWNAKETFRLFKEIKVDGGLQLEGVSIPLNSNLPRSNIGWVINHIERTLNHIERAEVEVSKWKLLREVVEDLSAEKVAIKKRFLEEKRRTASLYHSINDLVVEKTACENSLEEAKGKIKELKLELNRMRREKDDVAAAAKKLVEKRERLEKKRKKNAENETAKRSKIAHPIAPTNGGASSASVASIPSHLGTTPALASSAVHGNSSTTTTTATTPGKGVGSGRGSGAGSTSASASESPTPSPSQPYSEYAASWIGRKVMKHFKGYGDFVGVIKKYRHPFFEVRYLADDDSEDMTEREALRHLVPLEEGPQVVPPATGVVANAKTDDGSEVRKVTDGKVNAKVNGGKAVRKAGGKVDGKPDGRAVGKVPVVAAGKLDDGKANRKVEEESVSAAAVVVSEENNVGGGEKEEVEEDKEAEEEVAVGGKEEEEVDVDEGEEMS